MPITRKQIKTRNRPHVPTFHQCSHCFKVVKGQQGVTMHRKKCMGLSISFKPIVEKYFNAALTDHSNNIFNANNGQSISPIPTNDDNDNITSTNSTQGNYSSSNSDLHNILLDSDNLSSYVNESQAV